MEYRAKEMKFKFVVHDMFMTHFEQFYYGMGYK